jgi:predicted nucleic acid-binding protein
MKAYADTSFLFSLYLVDGNSPAARGAVRRHRPDFLLTPLHELELTNAIELQVFRRNVTPGEAQSAREDFEVDLERWPLRPLPIDAFARAVALAKRHSARLGARSFDILHVASAVSLDAEAFLSFDLRQRRMAKSEKLRVFP